MQEFAKPWEQEQNAYQSADSLYMTTLRSKDASMREDPDAYYKPKFKTWGNIFDYTASNLNNLGVTELGHPKLLKDRKLIARCFMASSVEEITKNLKAEELNPFAQKCLKAMESNSKRAMDLSLTMLRNAKNMDFKSILEMEMVVAQNKMQDLEFEKGVESVLLKRESGEEWRNLEEMSKDEVLKYF